MADRHHEDCDEYGDNTEADPWYDDEYYYREDFDDNTGEYE